ncbi:hypothetical protein BCR36DRAFT_368865 [Piromyces finnis]|uniref:Uncharacterized protein n=1 Tax=Piromyces finnis TaxID=1754191 RepID=A0A1Y1VE58_9FUNG|nr:hypothetical protein BCR36DRAFT_368865 [Piromyces finnis]|eukprot:ORX53848.1 hypothetical protein BCR36DRAFT_368865 [Piromyces finnis]
MDTTTKNKITDNISDNTKRENEKEGEDLKIHESTEDDKGIQEIPDIKLENKKEVCPNFNILSSCFISNKGCLKLGTDFKPNNDDKNGKLANMKESNNSEQDKIISPLFNGNEKFNSNKNNDFSNNWINNDIPNIKPDNSKNAFIQSSQPILNKNIINNNDNHLMDNCGDNKVFDGNK